MEGGAYGRVRTVIHLLTTHLLQNAYWHLKNLRKNCLRKKEKVRSSQGLLVVGVTSTPRIELVSTVPAPHHHPPPPLLCTSLTPSTTPCLHLTHHHPPPPHPCPAPHHHSTPLP